MTDRVFDLDKIKKFADEPQKIVVYTTDKTLGAMWCLEPGQEVFLHTHPTADDIWIVLEGEGIYFMGDGKEAAIGKGMAVLAAADQVHGMRNTGAERFSFIGIAGPVPVGLVRL